MPTPSSLGFNGILMEDEMMMWCRKDFILRAKYFQIGLLAPPPSLFPSSPGPWEQHQVEKGIIR